MSVRKDWLNQIPENSVAGVDAANLLGDKYINITKGDSVNSIKDGGTLKSLEAQDIPELMNRAGDMLGNFNKIVGRQGGHPTLPALSPTPRPRGECHGFQSVPGHV